MEDKFRSECEIGLEARSVHEERKVHETRYVQAATSKADMYLGVFILFVCCVPSHSK